MSCNDLFGDKTATERPEPNGYCIRKSGRNVGKKYNYYWRQGKSAERRSKTFKGIAEQMALQWGGQLIAHVDVEHIGRIPQK